MPHSIEQDAESSSTTHARRDWLRSIFERMRRRLSRGRVVRDIQAAIEPPTSKSEVRLKVLSVAHRPIEVTRRPLRKIAIVSHNGHTTATAIIRAAVKLMKVRWPGAKTFGAVTGYLEEAMNEVERQEHHRSRERREVETRARAQSERERREVEILKVKPQWNTLEESERDRFRQRVAAKHPHMARFDGLVEKFALREFARSRGAKIDTQPEAA